ncbi:hypothetical protein ACFY05_08665 [Microtetraspora fusca]|uniref:Uncharacterized protein n=1 Tax=Microtetraspora fusca TaxID=1997 RepID=A0ABW6V4U2_MICFU
MIKSLVVWTEEHQQEISTARTAYDERAAEEERLLQAPAALPR